MFNKLRPCFGVLFFVLAGYGSAQTASPSTARLQRVISHFDLGVSGIATFTSGVSGRVSNPTAVTPSNISQTASTAAGVLVTIRGQRSPYVGIEFNYGLARFAQTYSCCNNNTVGGGQVVAGPLVVQASANEYTLGYVVRPPHMLFGTQQYAAVGAGTMEFKPTTGGGQGLPLQARATYYAVGVEAPLLQHLSARAGFRQHFYLAPDFGQNYLQLNKRTFTSEPQIGLFLHF